MEQSGEYKEKIDAVRRLPQTTPEERGEKQREAKVFRMEVMLDNAQLTDTLIRTLERNPATTEDEFMHIAASSSMLAHPDSVQKFVSKLQDAKDNIQDRVAYWEKEIADGGDSTLVESLYLSVLKEDEKLKPNRRPQGDISLDTFYPL